jgi:hypothetical protein
MTRESTEVLLKQFGKTLAECVGECEVETGRKLGADFVISGRITRSGTRMALTLRLHATATGELLKTAEALGKDTDAVIDATDAAVSRLLGPISATDQMEKVYDLYKRDRRVSGAPRFDLAADVTGDRQDERVVLHDRDIVVFGTGFKGGTQYTSVTLQQFASPSDILDVRAEDIRGGGKSEIIVRGVLHANAPGIGGVDREVLLVFTVENETLRRVFAADIGRSMGTKRIVEKVRFGGGGIELAPGDAVEWTERTYPFIQDTGPVGGLEPLLLPWGGAQPVHYRWNGTAYSH